MLFVHFISCQKATQEESMMDDGSSDGQMEASFLADVEGVALNADIIDIAEISIEEGLVLRITAGNSATNQLLLLQFPSNIDMGSYNFSSVQNSENVYSSYKPIANGTSTFVSQSGILNITNTSSNLIQGNAVYTLANIKDGGVIEITFCEFSVAQ